VSATTDQPRWTLRWTKVWETEDGRGNVQRYRTAYGFCLFDAYLDGKHPGTTHRMMTAKRLVREALP
jgi:hypothetical protein